MKFSPEEVKLISRALRDKFRSVVAAKVTTEAEAKILGELVAQHVPTRALGMAHSDSKIAVEVQEILAGIYGKLWGYFHWQCLEGRGVDLTEIAILHDSELLMIDGGELSLIADALAEKIICLTDSVRNEERYALSPCATPPGHPLWSRCSAASSRDMEKRYLLQEFRHFLERVDAELARQDPEPEIHAEIIDDGPVAGEVDAKIDAEVADMVKAALGGDVGTDGLAGKFVIRDSSGPMLNIEGLGWIFIDRAQALYQCLGTFFAPWSPGTDAEVQS